MLLVLFFSLLTTASCLLNSGPSNRFYSIPFYYGPRLRDWNNTYTYFEDQPVLFFWAHIWNIDYKGNLWVVDRELHSVYYISKEIDTFNAVFKVSGKEG